MFVDKSDWTEWTDEDFAEYDRWAAETPVAAAVVIDANTCEHGLSKDLCAGPGHYPQDNPYPWEIPF
jgi:hypothetical protein